MDPRIADYIRANRRRYTRDVIREQLIKAGHAPADIDATWAALDAPDPDAVVGEGFWGRFWLFLVGLNVAVFLIVVLATGMLNSIVLAAVLGVALSIGALIAWGIVAATGPAQMGRTTAMVIGGLIPLVFALLIGGSCYALVGAIGPPPPPPREGVMELQIDPPLDFAGSGAAFCQVHETFPGFSIYPQQELGAINGRPVHASVDSFPADGGQDGGPQPAPAPGGELRPNLNMYISLQPRSEADPPQEWFVTPGTQLDLDATPDGLSGTVTFEGLEPVEFEPAGAGGGGEPISGTITWTCDQ
ncbi:MAG: hypothetical protein ACRDG7_03290 [Candidatus Limnocylindria bacterium]